MDAFPIVAALVFIALSVFSVTRALRKGFIMGSQALQTLLDSVANIGKEVGETADAIRNHVNSDSGISANVILEAADKLNAAANQLNDLQTGLAGTGDPSGGQEPGGVVGTLETPAEQPAPDAASGGQSNAGEDAAGSGTGTDTGLGEPGSAAPAGESAGNQNGIGSEFESGAGSDAASGEPPVV